MIDEIPIENTTVEKDTAEAIEETVEEKLPEIPEEVKPKKKGRPKGALNKQKPVVIEQAPIQEEEKEEPKKVKPKPKQRKKPPEPAEEEYVEQPQHFPSSHDIAAEVLSILSNRHRERANLKRERYRSWFQ